jgi:hypothetical protein
MRATVKITRPKFYDFFEVKPSASSHTCHCGEPATWIDGYYLVNTRRVRVWVCEQHRVGTPTTLLPTPEDILAGLRADQEYYDKMEVQHRWHPEWDADYGVSVKAMAPSGHGKAIHGDRVASWRWNGY